jgi:hypothetical protein
MNCLTTSQTQLMVKLGTNITYILLVKKIVVIVNNCIVPIKQLYSSVTQTDILKYGIYFSNMPIP